MPDGDVVVDGVDPDDEPALVGQPHLSWRLQVRTRLALCSPWRQRRVDSQLRFGTRSGGSRSGFNRFNFFQNPLIYFFLIEILFFNNFRRWFWQLRDNVDFLVVSFLLGLDKK